MTKFKQFSCLLSLTIFLMAVNIASAQWVWLINGSVNGAGTFPSIAVFGPNGYVVAGGPSGLPYVARSTDGGNSITPLGTTGISLELYCVWAIDASTIYVGDGGSAGGGGGNAKVYKTTNGGTSWSTLLQTGGSAGFFNWVIFSKVTPSFGVAQSDPPAGVGNTYYLAKTTDGGATWNPFSPQPPGVSGQATAQNAGVVIDALFIAMGLGNNAPARVYITNNGGTSWYVGNAGAPAGTGGFVSGVAFSTDKLRGFAGTSGMGSTLAKTTDGGVTWTSQSIGTGVTGYCTLRWIAGTNIVYVSGTAGASGVVKRSSDGGTTWTQMTTGGLGGITNFEYVKEANNVIDLYAVCGDGSVLRYRDSSLVTGIDPNNNNVPVEYKLEQNYPNPFNPTTTIKYALPKASNVSLKIYDMLGNEVISVVNAYQTPGNYVETIDASSLASGVYFYKLTAGDFTDSKKMTVVK